MYLVMNGRKVEELRAEKGWSRQALARAAGISPITLRRAEQEEPVLVSTARKVGEALEVNPRHLAQVYYAPEGLPVARAYAAEIVLSRNA
jgi:transcriptional regulator with XRE-family HTH domain